MRIHYALSIIALVIFSITIRAPAFALTDAEIEATLHRMSVDEKIGQLLLVGIGGKRVSQVAKAHITKRFAGGIILFGRNIADTQQVASLTTELQQVAQQTPNAIPLFIAIDQEGGIVARLKKGVTVFPGNLALGATRSERLAEKAGEITAMELSAVGVNLNFAPVMDINTNPRNPVIGVRAYGESAELVSQLGTAYIRGLQGNGILATAKHFPGHGDTHVDSHKKLPTVGHDKKRMDAVELAPFQEAIKAEVAAIMSAHILYPALDADTPATLSHRILTGLLREQLGFEGLIITDDLEMQAIDAHYQTGNAAVMAIQAGADLVMVPWTLKKQQQAYNALRNAVKRGNISHTRLDASVRRILKAKGDFGMFARKQGSSVLDGVGSPQHREIAQTIATQAITVVKDSDGILPLSSESRKPITLITASRIFANAFLKSHTDTAHITHVKMAKQLDVAKLLPQLTQQQAAVVVAGITNAQQAALIHQLSQNSSTPIVVVSLASPYLLGRCPDVAAAIAAYDGNYSSALAAVEVILGKQQATGKLPVTIPPRVPEGEGNLPPAETQPKKRKELKMTRHTSVSITDDAFYINGEITYPGRSYEGHKVEGLLMNTRMVQGIFDDRNPETLHRWEYPDTGKWDAERNTREFLAAMPEWRAHGILAFTINLQGGSPEGYSKAQPWHNSGIESDGSLNPDYLSRLERIIARADELGMVVILGYFYFGQDHRLTDEAAVIRATDNATHWLFEQWYTNVIVEVNNECNVRYSHEILQPERVHELIERVKATTRDGKRFLVGTSYGGGRVPFENVVRASDFLLVHGNGVKDPNRIVEMVRQTREVPGYRPMPILFNEDDHFDFDKPFNNCVAAVSQYASWGYFDPGENDYHHGYQSVPVQWQINTPRKRAFFNKVRDITGVTR